MHHPTDRITHTTAFVTPVVEHWLEREIAQWVHSMKDRSDDPSRHERTLLSRRYISLPPFIQLETVNFLRTNNIDFIDDWSAISPDLNPIEHVWGSLVRRLRRRPNPPANVNELRQALIQEWNNIPQAEINTLVKYMRRRCTAVVNSRGGHTRY